MRVVYYKDGSKHTTTKSNQDITISEIREGNHTIIKLTASATIKLAEAYIDYPCHVNYKDLYFLNGYQSWTDTKEFKLSTQLRDIK